MVRVKTSHQIFLQEEKKRRLTQKNLDLFHFTIALPSLFQWCRQKSFLSKFQLPLSTPLDLKPRLAPWVGTYDVSSRLSARKLKTPFLLFLTLGRLVNVRMTVSELGGLNAQQIGKPCTGCLTASRWAKPTTNIRKQKGPQASQESKKACIDPLQSSLPFLIPVTPFSAPLLFDL